MSETVAKSNLEKMAGELNSQLSFNSRHSTMHTVHVEGGVLVDRSSC